jgi:hypothetical protein
MDKDELGPSRRRALCSTLATLALEKREPELLEALLEVHGDSEIEWFFDQGFHFLKDKARKSPRDLDVIRVVENSKFKSSVPPGERYKQPHALDML